MRWLSKKRYIAFLLTPALLSYVVYIILPIFISIYYSFTRYSGVGEAVPVGFANYIRLFQNAVFGRAIANSLIIMGTCMVILLPLSLLAAVLLNSGLKGARISKTILFAPAIMAPIIVGILWVFILDPSIGFINDLLRELNLDVLALMWIGGDKLTPFSVAFVYAWQQMGYYVSIFYAGLKMIPGELYEAAEIDGASRFQQLTQITLPQLKGTISVVVVLIMNGTLKIFEVVQQLTEGGPNHISEVMVTYSYSTTFRDAQYGYGMSMAVVTFLICFVFSAVYLTISNRQAKEDA